MGFSRAVDGADGETALAALEGRPEDLALGSCPNAAGQLVLWARASSTGLPCLGRGPGGRVRGCKFPIDPSRKPARSSHSSTRLDGLWGGRRPLAVCKMHSLLAFGREKEGGAEGLPFIFQAVADLLFP